MDNCKESIYSEEYADYIIETGGNVEAIRRKYNPDCIQVIDENFVIIFEKIVDKGEISFEKYGCDHMLQSSEIRQKINQTVKERYGVNNPMQNPNIYAYARISSILIFSSSVCLFLYFKKLKLKVSKWINTLGNVSFGAYLFHEHI